MRHAAVLLLLATACATEPAAPPEALTADVLRPPASCNVVADRVLRVPVTWNMGGGGGGGGFTSYFGGSSFSRTLAGIQPGQSIGLVLEFRDRLIARRGDIPEVLLSVRGGSGGIALPLSGVTVTTGGTMALGTVTAGAQLLSGGTATVGADVRMSFPSPAYGATLDCVALFVPGVAVPLTVDLLVDSVEWEVTYPGSDSGPGPIAYGTLPPPDPFVSISGTCPGPMVFDVSGARPGGPTALVWGSGFGADVAPWTGVCGGTPLGVSGPVVVAAGLADGAGRFRRRLTVPAAACSGVMTAIEASRCTVAEPELIP